MRHCDAERIFDVAVVDVAAVVEVDVDVVD